MSLHEFQIVKKVGEGTFSNVYQVHRLSDGNDYALKKIPIAKLSFKEQQNALNEIRILASIHDPYIIGFHQAFIDETTMCLWYYLVILVWSWN